MIVVDTNVLAYLFTEGPYRDAAEASFIHDGDWHARFLWRSEFRNLITVMLRKRLCDLPAAMQAMRSAEELMQGHEHIIGSEAILRLATRGQPGRCAGTGTVTVAGNGVCSRWNAVPEWW